MSLVQRNSSPKRLKSRKLIGQIFQEGKSLFVHPIKLFYIEIPSSNESGFFCGYSVPKRLHKKATSRNLLKRRMREACRRHIEILDTHTISDSHCAWGFMYVLIDNGLTEYDRIDRSIHRIHKKFVDRHYEKNHEL